MKDKKKIEILEARLEALADHFKLKIIAEDQGDWVDVEVIKRKRNRYLKL
jgi:anti-sigma regulatory factor (Ser/Thr protein kinase)